MPCDISANKTTTDVYFFLRGGNPVCCVNTRPARGFPGRCAVVVFALLAFVFALLAFVFAPVALVFVLPNGVLFLRRALV